LFRTDSGFQTGRTKLLLPNVASAPRSSHSASKRPLFDVKAGQVIQNRQEKRILLPLRLHDCNRFLVEHLRCDVVVLNEGNQGQIVVDGRQPHIVRTRLLDVAESRFASSRRPSWNAFSPAWFLSSQELCPTDVACSNRSAIIGCQTERQGIFTPPARSHNYALPLSRECHPLSSATDSCLITGLLFNLRCTTVTFLSACPPAYSFQQP